jgi:hypothetical protein
LAACCCKVKWGASRDVTNTNGCAPLSRDGSVPLTKTVAVCYSHSRGNSRSMANPVPLCLTGGNYLVKPVQHTVSVTVFGAYLTPTASLSCVVQLADTAVCIRFALSEPGMHVPCLHWLCLTLGRCVGERHAMGRWLGLRYIQACMSSWCVAGAVAHLACGVCRGGRRPPGVAGAWVRG